jgi:predicted MPP superfamily phosphohydrolase
MGTTPTDTEEPGLRSARWVRAWLIALNAGLVLAALALGIAWSSRRALFLAALVPVAIVPFSFARLRLHRAIANALGTRTRLVALIAVMGVLLDGILVAQLLTGRASSSPWILSGPGVNWIGPVWFSAHGLLFLGYAIAGAIRGAEQVGRRAWKALASGEEARADASVESPARREFLQRAGLVGAGVPFFVSLSGVPLSYDLRVEEHEIELPHWPKSLDGFRIVHLSDIHVGGGMNRARLLHMAELTNSCQPDLVAHTGDFLTHRSGDFDEPLYEALARIRARHGQWACLGNHDYDDPDRFTRRLAVAGVAALRDGHTVIDVGGQPLEIAGAEYVARSAPRADLYTRLVESWPPRGPAPRILLNHDPSAFADLPAGCADLVLSGHTHGGHVGVQLGRDSALTVVGLVGIPDQGLFRRGDMRLFVTRCVGFYGYPMRVGIPPEVALLVLRSPRPKGTTA